MRVREKRVITFLEKRVIGVMYLSATGDAFLNYCYKNDSKSININDDETKEQVCKILELAKTFCKVETYDLRMC